MNKIKISFFIILIIVIFGISIEVINPHSFLGVVGAMIRGVLLLISFIAWYIFMSKKESKFFLPGSFVLLVSAVIYFLSGASLFCQNTAYEKSIPSEDYNCKNIIIRKVFN
jgi:hypothetical protein